MDALLAYIKDVVFYKQKGKVLLKVDALLIRKIPARKVQGQILCVYAIAIPR